MLNRKYLATPEQLVNFGVLIFLNFLPGKSKSISADLIINTDLLMFFKNYMMTKGVNVVKCSLLDTEQIFLELFSSIIVLDVKLSYRH